MLVFVFFKQKTAYEMRISDWSSDVCSSDLLQALQVEQRIDHDLAGAVVGHLATTVDVQHRDVAGHQHVLGLAGLAEGEHRVVLAHPDLVGRRFSAHVGETLHSATNRCGGPAAEVADDGGPHAHAYTTPLTPPGEGGRGGPRFGMIHN